MTTGRWSCRFLAAGLALVLTTGVSRAESLEDAVRARNFHQATAQIQRLLPRAESEERTRLLVLLFECQVELERVAEARETLALIDPRRAPSRFFRVRGQFQILNDQDELAGRDFEQALKLSTTSEEKIVALCELAMLKADSALWSQALEEASEVDEAPPSVWRKLYQARHRMYSKSGDFQAALDLCRSVRRGFEAQSDETGVLWSYLAEVDSLTRLKRLEDAEKTWVRALEVSGKDSAPVILMWSYASLYDRIDPVALKRIIPVIERHWALSSKHWSEYERYHVRMLQAQIWLHGFDQPAEALSYLRLAEPLASRTPRPAGERMAVKFDFHKFGDGNPSDIEQVLWLQLRCLTALQRPESEINDFMREKLELLPPRERPAWLITLGKRYLPSQPEMADKFFAQALQNTSGSLRDSLLAEMMDTFHEAGQVKYASAKERELRSHVEQPNDPSNQFKVFRHIVSQCLDREWSQALWCTVWGTQESLTNRHLFSRLYGEQNRLTALEEKLRRDLEQYETAGKRFSASLLLYHWAQLLTLQERYTEALVICDKGKRLDADTRNYYHEIERLNSMVLFKLGETDAALESVREARRLFANSDRFGAEDGELDCAIMEIGYLMELEQYPQALQLLAAYEPRSEGQDARSLALVRARALLKTDQLDPALAALENLEIEVPQSLFSVAVKAQRAEILTALARTEQARIQLEEALSLAVELGSENQCDVVLKWYQLDPASAPIREVAERIAADPETRIPTGGPRQRVLELAGLNSGPLETGAARWLSQTEFLRETDNLMLTHPPMATTVPVLPAGLVRSADQLPRDQVLVEYFAGEKELVIMVVAEEGFAVHRLAVEGKTLARWADAVRSDPDAARQLGRTLIEPLGPQCSGRPLTILGHGPLLSLPWDLLQLKDGPLVALHEWRLWAGPVLSPRRLSPPAGYRVLALGGVTGLDLPGSRREVESLRSTGVGEVRVLTGQSANGLQLRNLLPNANVLHLATHSSPSAIQLSDGHLRLKEIYDLPLNPGTLVVLSSCESGDPGQQQRGPVTLAGAFLAAGASEVVAATHRVSDVEAEALFKIFYAALADGLTPSAALRRAKLQRASRNPEGDWSKFVLLGG